ncbi:GNAT family N-acetyltransferase [Nocardioides sp. CPCC 205120]|uniref:GNAT family N-acetyltransferase n=1 Tax=Nocardioides sp. CPCC 205120 TaxID=3406462 RepID=UPI003B50F312
MDPVLRAATVDDVEALRTVEAAAGAAFRTLGMDLVADDEPPPAAVLAAEVARGPAWVFTVDGRVVAYLLGDVVDGCAHVHQVSVHPDHAGRRHGAALVERLVAWAGDRGLPAVTLTTYRDVPWNGPYYRRLGFRWLADHEVTPGLRRLRAAEAAAGLDAWPRGCMRRDLG